MAERPGFRLVTLKGRGYPTPRAAITKLKESLAADGYDVPDGDIEARKWTDAGICPWEAVAWVPEDWQPPKKEGPDA